MDLIWEQEIPTPGGYTILPSGKVELMFPYYPITNLDAIKIGAKDNPVNNHTCFLSGLHTRPLIMSFERFYALGIQMKPVAVKALFGMPLANIRDYFVEGAIILDSIRSIEEQIHSKSSFVEKAQWIETLLIKKMNETADLHTAINLDRVIKKYFVQKQNGSPKSVEHLLGYSRTQSYRLFNEWFGISSHSYLKLLQFIQSVETLHNRNIKLTDVGLDNGYYDQSHFIRTFQEFAGMTPGAYRNQMTALPGQIFRET